MNVINADILTVRLYSELYYNHSVVTIISEFCDRVMAHGMVLVLVAAALLQTVRTETAAPDAQDNYSNNG